MSDLREAAQKALEALRSEYPAVRLYAVQALEKALAEPEQEPVSLNDGRLTQYPDGSIGVGTPTTRKPLTDQEIDALDNLPSYPSDAEVIAFARRIEQAHGIK